MQRVIVLNLLLELSVGVFGNECAAGHKHRADLAGRMCVDAAIDAASCNSECCAPNEATCGGLSGISCEWDSYKGNDDAWKNTAASVKNKNKMCCKRKAICSQAVCPAGKKLSNPTTLCAGGSETCALNALCCMDDVNKCGGAAVGKSACTDLTTHANWGSSGSWKNTAIGGTQSKADFTTACCKPIMKCDKAACPAGQKKVATPANVKCNNKAGVVTADPNDCSRDQLADNGAIKKNPCCENDPATCGGAKGAGMTCGIGMTDSGSGQGWKIAKTTAGDAAKFVKYCCTTVATCGQASCPGGYKKKAKVEAIQCPGNIASCTAAANLATCCEVDKDKCGGLTDISCKYGFFDERITWNKKTPQAIMDLWKNKAANETNKDANCCTTREVCKVPLGTTTPSPVGVVVTTTPGAPALKYSEHKIAVVVSPDRPSGANMVWLGVGGLIGMGVIMIVQGLHSKMQAAPSDSIADAEDARVLLDAGLE